MHGVVADLGPQPNRVDGVTRQHATPGEQPTGLPVGQTQFRLIEGELAVDPPGETIADKSFDEDDWQLYNLNEDFNERVNLAKKYPEKLTELKKIFDEQAEKNHLYPLIDWHDVNNKKIHHPNGTEVQGPIK